MHNSIAKYFVISHVANFRDDETEMESIIIVTM